MDPETVASNIVVIGHDDPPAVIAAVILLTSLCGVIATPSLVGVGSGPASLKHR